MDNTIYLNFDLLIQKLDQEAYQTRVLKSPAGEATATFVPPLQDASRQKWAEMASVKTLGRDLFESLFQGRVESCLRRSLDEAQRQGARLRIRLHLTDVPKLAALPWEYLYDPTDHHFFSLSAETPIVRYLDLPQYTHSLAVKPPLKVLALVSSPSDVPPLEVDREWAKLHEALNNLAQRGLVALERLEEATLAALQRRLRQDEFHVLHFMGHADFDKEAQDGLLILEDEAGRSRRVSGHYLATLLRDHRSLRLAVLNACQGARAAESDSFAGVAQSLVQQGTPAVIAMQFEMTDEAATTFAQEFYAALADAYPVDAALAEARKAIFAQGNEVEWGTPVLYMRSPDGRLFDVSTPSYGLVPRPDTLAASDQPVVAETRPAVKPTSNGRLHESEPTPGVPTPLEYASELRDIGQQLQRRRLALFIGSDLPKRLTGLPSPRALADALATQEGIASGQRLADVTQQVMGAGNRWTFTDFLQNTLDTVGQSPQLFHCNIASLVQVYQIEMLITTAYDNLLELAFQQAGVGLNLVVRDDNLRFVRPERPTLLKLYGDRPQADTLVVTEQDRNALLRGRLKREMVDEVRHAFRRNSVLFLGYDLSDPAVSALFDEVTGDQFQMRSYAIWSGLSQREKEFLRSQRNLTILETDPLAFLQTLLDKSGQLEHPMDLSHA